MRITQALLIALTTYSVGVSAQFGGFGGNRNGGGGNNNNNNNGGQGGNNNNGGDQNNNNGGDQNNNNGGDQNNNNGGQGGNNNGGGATLNDNARQDASNSPGEPDAAAGQSDSITDPDNFINFCSGKQLTNGQQVQGGSCNGIVMGEIPGTGNMITAAFQNPTDGDNIQADQTFDIAVQVNNLAAGSFTDPDTTYYSAPQTLQGGNIVGHTHVTCQVVDGTNPPNPQEFAFFKGINDQGNGNGLLSATVDGGLAAGSYRCCSMTSASNHQPVIMPVAQRGAQDDCVRFTVGGNGGNNNNGGNNGGNNNNNGGQQNNQDQNQGQDQGQGQDGQNGQDQGQGQDGQNGQDQGQGDQNNQDQNQDQNQGQDQGQGDQNNQGQNQGGQNNGGGNGGGFGGFGGRGGFGGFGGRRNKGRFMARDYVA